MGAPVAEAELAPDDRRYLRRALALARRGLGRTAPNPPVGCVLVRGATVVGEGFHRRAGLPHAEVEALTVAGRHARGATAYVTLEPCNHRGRTGPCTEALLAGGVARVLAAIADPNPRVAGGGGAWLRSRGVRVDIGGLADEAAELAGGFLRHVASGRPRVTLKAAVSLDGRLAASSGDSRWITGPAARREAHRLRDQSDAILVGAGTVRADDPALTTRLPGGHGRDALVVILDGGLRISEEARVVRPGSLVATSLLADEGKAARLRARGAEVVRLPGSGSRVDLGALLDELGRRAVLDLLVEGGGEVHGELLGGGFVDRVRIFVAPKLIGAAGRPLVALPGATTMAEAWSLQAPVVRRFGDDVLIGGRLR